MHRNHVLLLVSIALVGCDSTSGPEPTRTFEFDFAEDDGGWQSGFADYAVGMEILPVSGYEPDLPAEIEREGGGVFIAGSNPSDDLFMFWKRRVGWLAEDARYVIDFEVEFVTRAATGCSGIGGAPGESVYVHAGATADEPMVVIEDEAGFDMYRMNIDKGNQAQGGDDAIVIGDIAGTNTDCLNPVWELKTLSGAGLEVRASDRGQAWLIVGSDSGFEGRTELYYVRVHAVFTHE